MQPETIITDNELPPEVVKAITQGRKIEAIKLLREATGIGLANAKVLVDRASHRYAQLNSQVPNLAEESNTGKLLGMTLILFAVYALYRYLNGG